MNLPTQAERDLFDYLSPEGRADVEKHYADIDEPAIDDDEIDEAELADNSAELMIRPMSLLEPYDYKHDR